MNGTINRPSENFVQTLKDMIVELAAMGEYGAAQAEVARTAMNEAWTAGRFDQAAARKAFGGLKDAKARARAILAQNAPKAEVKTWLPKVAKREIPAVPAGRYALPSNTADPEKIRFFKVEVDGTYYKVFVQAGPELHQMRFPAFITVLQEILDFGLLESAILYGKTLKICARCGIELTKPESRERGIGPICATKY